MMKFALFLVCALVAVQASSVERSDRGLNDIGEAIKDAVDKIKHIVSDISSQINKVIQNIRDAANVIVGKVPEFIHDIKQKVEDLIHLAGETGRKCLDAHQGQIDALVEFVQDGIQACNAEAESKVNVVKDQIDFVVAKADALREDIGNRAIKCLEKLNPVAIVKCLKEQIEPINDQIVEIQEEVVKTIALAETTAQEAVSGLAECGLEVNQEVTKRQAEILDSIKDCITNQS